MTGDPAVCRPETPDACAWRYAAIRRGDFYFDHIKCRWYWRKAINPHRPWDICPWCGGTLIDLVGGVVRAMRLDPAREAVAECYHDEDGG